MKTVILSAIVAIIVSAATTMVLQDSSQDVEPQASMILEPQINYEQIAEQLNVKELSVSMEPEAAAWIRLNTGIESSEQKILANAANSACFLTHVEISGIQSPQDKNSCSITLDDFTGFWQVNASTGEGTQSELYCNARCIIWE